MHTPDQHPKAADCLSMEELSGYIQGKLTDSEVRKVEAHITDCDLCATALEGLMTNGTPEEHEQAIAELREQIQPTQTARIKVLFPFRVAAAAALLIGSMTLLWVFVPKHTEQAYSPEKKSTVTAPTQIQANPVEQSTSAAEPVEKPSTETHLIAPATPQDENLYTARESKVVADEAVPAIAEAPAENSNSDDDRLRETEPQIQGQETSAKQQIDANRDLQKDVNKPEAKELVATQATVQGKENRQLVSGKACFSKGDYACALHRLEPQLALVSGPEKEELLWILGKASMELGQRDKGLAYLRTCISLKGSHEQEADAFLKKKGY